MIGILFFFLFLAAESYFISLVKSHLFDTTVEILSTRRLQSDVYAESICLYLGFLLTKKETIGETMNMSPIIFEYPNLSDHDRIQATVSVMLKKEHQYIIEIQCARHNQKAIYCAKINIENDTFSITEFDRGKKELFQ